MTKQTLKRVVFVDEVIPRNSRIGKKNWKSYKIQKLFKMGSLWRRSCDVPIVTDVLGGTTKRLNRFLQELCNSAIFTIDLQTIPPPSFAGYMLYLIILFG